MDETLRSFFQPRGVVVIGASASEDKLGYGLARNLIQSGYGGAITLVGKSGGVVLGHPIHPTLKSIASVSDLAVLAVPAAAVPAALEDCAAQDIKSVIIVSAGFRETGVDGEVLESGCLEIARRRGLRILGPNCIGIIDTHLPLDTTFLQPPMPPSGGIGFISHSGAFCAAIIDWSRRQGFGFSRIVSLGNQLDIDETDVLSALAGDSQTRVIALYMEGVADGRKFVRAATEIASRMPVIALKVGRTESGRKAASSHTAAMAGKDAAFDAAFKKAGVLRAASAEQLFDWARALEHCPIPNGNRVAVLTDAGGPGVIAADALESEGMTVSPLHATTRSALLARLPAAASVNNPVDMLASASPEDYAFCLNLLLDDPDIDAVLLILPPPPVFTADAVAQAVIPIIKASRKPVLIALLGSVLTEAAFHTFAAARVPTYPFPERAASALASLWRRGHYLRTRSGGVPVRAAGLTDKLGLASPLALLEAYGISVVPLKSAHTAQEAAAVADGVGYPVVMKIASEHVSHKSDIGGVVLNVQDAGEARRVYAQLIDTVRASRPGAAIEGVHIQPQIAPGQDIIIGATRDPQFGPMVMFGSGGIETEGLHDVSFALAPLSDSEAEEMMQQTWAGRRLHGFRSLPPADFEAARRAVVGLSQLIGEHDEIRGIEINPLRVLERGALALDVRLD